MTVVNAAQAAVKTVADPNAAYESLKPLWLKSRAACSGERFVKAYDNALDVQGFSNLLIPFSPSMRPEQYAFYKAEAEWPGITAQFSKMLVGGLLRKPPQLTFREGANIPEEAKAWILNEFGRDDASLVAFMDEALNEQVQTSAPWLFVDYPALGAKELDAMSEEDRAKLKPYPVLQPAESVINWRLSKDRFGKAVLDRVIVRGLSERYGPENEFHPELVEVIYVHELDESGHYQIREFEREIPETNVPVVAGKTQQNTAQKIVVKLVNSYPVIVNDKPLPYIPAWPLDGVIQPPEPMLMALIDKEVALYNKMSRRNHLLYGSATYTPVISTDMDEEEFDKVVGGGLGTWIKLEQGDTADVLKTPTEALEDMERTIAAAIEEMARLGIRMMTPETEQSGVALEIRNASQTAQLGTLNTRVSEVLRQVIVFMLNWRYDLQLVPDDVEFSLSSDFNPAPLGADWLRLATEWYEAGLIPRSVWLQLLKVNDLVPPDYDDEEGRKEITSDEIIQATKAEEDYVKKLEKGA